MLNFLSDIFGAILAFFTDFTGNLGLGIILLTVAIRLALYPLTLSQSRSMAGMRKLQPKMQELQKKYKDKPQEYQKHMMELYQEHKINPLGGCLPVLVQLPFLWALFAVLRDISALLPDQDPSFLFWNLTTAAQELGGLADLNVSYLSYLILPLLAGATTYLQMQLTSAGAEPSQRTMMMIMPVFLFYISTNFPAGLVLYWVISNVFGIGQQYVINRQLEAANKGEGAG